MAGERLHSSPEPQPSFEAVVPAYVESHAAIQHQIETAVREADRARGEKSSTKKDKKKAGKVAVGVATEAQVDEAETVDGQAQVAESTPQQQAEADRMRRLGQHLVWGRENTPNDVPVEAVVFEQPATLETTSEDKAEATQNVEPVAPIESIRVTEDDAVNARLLQERLDGGMALQPEQQHMQAEAPEPMQPVSAESSAEATQPVAAEAPAEQEPVVAGSEAEPEAEPAEVVPDMPPPLPPNPELFNRYYSEPPAGDSLRQSEPVSGAAVRTPKPKRYASNTPPGYQRTPADVSRAAWTGAIVGWWVGRRGKRKAVETAHKAGLAAGAANERRRAKPQLEAEPLHSYASEAGRKVVEPLSVETRPAAVEAVAMPAAAAVAAIERLRAKAEKQPVPEVARDAARRATEHAVVRAEKLHEQSAAVPGAKPERSLAKGELLKVAKDIKFDGVSLREVYNAQRIDEEGLRTIVATYLRGGDVRKALSSEIATKEMSFERDPLLRHRREGETAGKPGERLAQAATRGAAAARSLAGDRGTQLAAAAKETALKAGKTVAGGARQAQTELVDNGKTQDWAMFTAVIVVWSAIVWILTS